MAPSSYFFRGLYRRLAKRNKKKIFVIGFHKTGTTSLAKALLVLGYRVCGFVNPKNGIEPSSHSREELFESTYKPLLDEYDAFEDTLWFIYYQKLTEMYPDAKFILTVRPEDNWYKSMVKHFGGDDRPIFRWIYEGEGDPIGNEELYIQKYKQHNQQVKDYFEEKEKDLLIMHMPKDFDWYGLCKFLDCRKPFGNFPHANSASSRGTFRRKIIDQMKSRYYQYNKM